MMEQAALDSNLSDFLDTLLDHPLDLHHQIFPGQKSFGVEYKDAALGRPGFEPPDMLQAQSFTDVLVKAADWNGVNIPDSSSAYLAVPAPDAIDFPPASHAPLDSPHQNSDTWGNMTVGSMPVQSGQWQRDGSFQDNLSSSAHAAYSWPPQDSNMLSQWPSSSHNSGDKFADNTTEAGLAADDITSDKDDRFLSGDDMKLEAGKRRGSKPKPARKSSETQLEQRRNRKREKDRIEELQAEIHKIQESTARVHGSIQSLTARLQEKEEEVRKVRSAEDSTLSAADDDRLAASFDGPIRLTIHDNLPSEAQDLKPDELRVMSEAELCRLWQKYVMQIKDLLCAGNKAPQDRHRILQRITTLQREAILIQISSAFCNPPVAKRIMVAGCVNRQPETPLPSTFWSKVVNNLHLEAEQRAKAEALWHCYQSCIGKLMEVRSSITQHMSGTIPDGLFGRSFAINFLKAHELMDALKYNLRQEHIVLNELMVNFHKMLTPLQNASCLVNSWPYWPDTPQLVLAIAANQVNESFP